MGGHGGCGEGVRRPHRRPPRAAARVILSLRHRPRGEAAVPAAAPRSPATGRAIRRRPLPRPGAPTAAVACQGRRSRGESLSQQPGATPRRPRDWQGGRPIGLAPGQRCPRPGRPGSGVGRDHDASPAPPCPARPTDPILALSMPSKSCFETGSAFCSPFRAASRATGTT